MKNERVIKLISDHYGKRLERWYLAMDFDETLARELRDQYVARFKAAMSEADFGPDNAKFSSYANCLSGLLAYAIAREQGLSMGDGVVCYDYMANPLRRFAAWLWNTVDLLPNGFSILSGNVREDLMGPKGVCWQTEVVEDSADRFEYRCHACLYYEICCSYGYPEAIQLFCNHDHYAWDGLHRHVRFERYGGIGELLEDGSLPDGLLSTEPGCLCHDAFIRVR